MLPLPVEFLFNGKPFPTTFLRYSSFAVIYFAVFPPMDVEDGLLSPIHRASAIQDPHQKWNFHSNHSPPYPQVSPISIPPFAFTIFSLQLLHGIGNFLFKSPNCSNYQTSIQPNSENVFVSSANGKLNQKTQVH